jgi:hypothetical protein
LFRAGLKNRFFPAAHLLNINVEKGKEEVKEPPRLVVIILGRNVESVIVYLDKNGSLILLHFYFIAFSIQLEGKGDWNLDPCVVFACCCCCRTQSSFISHNKYTHKIAKTLSNEFSTIVVGC